MAKSKTPMGGDARQILGNSDGAASRRQAMRSRRTSVARTRTEIVHERLREAIIEQQLRPGMRLPEDAIGESFGTSRTIAREALGRLAVEGLVELLPNRGAFVANPSLDEGRDIFTVRRGLERIVAETLAGRLTAAHVAELAAFSEREQQAASSNSLDSIRLAGEFHLLLARMTGNHLLLRYVTETVSRCSLIIAMYGRPHSAECGVNEHAEIVAALVAGDAAGAAKRMDDHLLQVASRAMIENRQVPDIREVLLQYARRK